MTGPFQIVGIKELFVSLNYYQSWCIFFQSQFVLGEKN